MQRDSRAPSPTLQVVTPATRLQRYIPPRRHSYSGLLALHTSMPPRLYTHSEPRAFHTSSISASPRLQSSLLHASRSPRLHVYTLAVSLDTLCFHVRTPCSTPPCSRAQCLHTYTSAVSPEVRSLVLLRLTCLQGVSRSPELHTSTPPYRDTYCAPPRAPYLRN